MIKRREKDIYMQQIQGEWAIIGVLGMVLFIVVIGKKIQMLLNFMIRIVLGGIGIISVSYTHLTLPTIA